MSNKKSTKTASKSSSGLQPGHYQVTSDRPLSDSELPLAIAVASEVLKFDPELHFSTYEAEVFFKAIRKLTGGDLISQTIKSPKIEHFESEYYVPSQHGSALEVAAWAHQQYKLSGADKLTNVDSHSARVLMEAGDGLYWILQTTPALHKKMQQDAIDQEDFKTYAELFKKFGGRNPKEMS